ncbi:hypothetical protein ACEWY4_018174 [Coilia grayii]|uniref:Immunoglobulin V-set domain-containing protein n=1 Tax=Coilia grayii TaxID=363190 RepID=A0ABD1JKB8_9TELE
MMMERLWQSHHILQLLSVLVCFVTGLSVERIERRREGENIEIPCSTDQLNQDGMYLYKSYDQKQEVTFLHKKMESSPRTAFENRVQITGELNKVTATITNLTIDDTGVFWCQYLRYEGPKQHYTDSKDGWILLVVTGVERCPTPGTESHPPRPDPEVQMSTLLIVSAITGCSLVLLVLIILIIGVKRWCVGNGKYKPGPENGVGLPDHRSDSVYEQMRPQRATSMSQCSGQVLINPAYSPSRNYI